jgi:hypothetical protein
MPGPPPTHQPPFPADFLDRARALLRQRTAPSHLRQRARLACLLADQPSLPHPAAATLCQLWPVTVRKWRRRWAGGDFSLADRPGRGRKPTFSPAGPRRRPGAGLRAGP